MEDFADVQFLFLKIHCDILYSLVCLHICSTLPWLGLAIYIFVFVCVGGGFWDFCVLNESLLFLFQIEYKKTGNKDENLVYCKLDLVLQFKPS